MASVNQIPNPDDNKPHQTTLEPPEAEPSQGKSPKPFVVPERAGAGAGRDKTKTILIGIIGAFVLFVALFGLISTKGKSKSKSPGEAEKPSLGRVVTPSAPGQIIPSENAAAPIATQGKTGALDAHDIEKTRVASLSNHSPNQAMTGSTSPMSNKAAPGKALGQINQFQQPDTDPQHLRNWAPEPYQGQDRGKTNDTVNAGS